MAYCVKCGAQIKEGGKFCIKCGTPTESMNESAAVQPASNNAVSQMGMVQPQEMQMTPQQVQMQQMQMVQMMQNMKTTMSAQERQASLKELQSMMTYFGQKKEQYIEYDKVSTNIDYLERPRSVALLVWGIILSVLFGLPGIISIIGAILDRDHFWVSFLSGLLAILPGGLMIAGYYINSASKNKEKESKYKRLVELTEELEDHFNKYGYCTVGMEYTDPQILELIYNVIRQGRADSPKEAINVMIQDAHRTEMEMQAAEMAMNARAAAVNSRRSAGGTIAAAGFFAASLFFR